MAKRAVEQIFDGATITTPYTAYDSTKINLGALIIQDGTNNFMGPMTIGFTRPMEQSTAIASQYPHAIQISSDLWWVFLADLSTAGATRRIVLYTYVPSTSQFTWRGFITMTMPSATAHTIRGMRVVKHLYTTGTASASGTAVTGSGTAWQTARYAVGARIGFGSTDPTAITTWYHISAIGSNTTITLQENAGSVSDGPFVIEELRVYVSTTNATAANGGLFVAKGCNYDDFTTGGTNFAAAVSTDNVKATYWLADAATVLNTAAGGCVLSDTVSDTSHFVYVPNADAGTSLRFYKYNVRASLTVASGKSTSAFVLRTGAQTVAGTISQTNNGRMAALNHGPTPGVDCIYMVTTTRVYRIREEEIIDASTTFVGDCMVELPTGSVSTFALTSGFTSVEYAGTIDRLVITTGANQRMYVTRYNTSANSTFDHVFGANNAQLDQSLADAGLTPWPNNSVGYSVWIEAGIAFLAKTGTTALLNFIYAVPIGADWTYAAGTSTATQNRLITPELFTPEATKLYRVYTNHAQYLGSTILGLQPEPYRIYARTSGIVDDSGDWTLLDENGQLSSFAASTSIQFMIEFRVIGPFCIPAKVYGITCLYEDSSTDSHYQPSVANSSTSANRFAWRFSTAFGGTVPTLTVKIYDAVTGNLLLTDTTAAETSGSFEKSTNDGSSWGSYNTSDKANEITYIRYTPSTFGTNIKARAILTQ